MSVAKRTRFAQTSTGRGSTVATVAVCARVKLIFPCEIITAITDQSRHERLTVSAASGREIRGRQTFWQSCGPAGKYEIGERVPLRRPHRSSGDSARTNITDRFTEVLSSRRRPAQYIYTVLWQAHFFGRLQCRLEEPRLDKQACHVRSAQPVREFKRCGVRRKQREWSGDVQERVDQGHIILQT